MQFLKFLFGIFIVLSFLTLSGCGGKDYFGQIFSSESDAKSEQNDINTSPPEKKKKPFDNKNTDSTEDITKKYNVKFKFYSNELGAETKRQIYPPEDIKIFFGKGLAELKKNAEKDLLLKKQFSESVINTSVKKNNLITCKNYDFKYVNKDKKHNEIIVQINLIDRHKKNLFIYYPLQYKTSFRSGFFKNNEQAVISLDMALRDFIIFIQDQEIYDKIKIRFSKEIIVDPLNDKCALFSHLFYPRNIYENNIRYGWGSNLFE
ncbi:MAG: hypothetical protein ACQESP_13125, partial [Candidatus Muiribacteriota bacterium]